MIADVKGILELAEGVVAGRERLFMLAGGGAV